MALKGLLGLRRRGLGGFVVVIGLVGCLVRGIGLIFLAVEGSAMEFHKVEGVDSR